MKSIVDYYDPIINKYYQGVELEYDRDSQNKIVQFINNNIGGEKKASAGPDGSVIWYNPDGKRHVANTGSIVYRRKDGDHFYVGEARFFEETMIIL